jgi:transposase
MELLFTHCAGMDVHKDSVVVCVRVASGTGPASERVERFGTINSELQRLRAFLEGQQVDAVAMESTGVFWKPIWNLLEGSSFKLILVNARHVKNVPGRKTDVMDCQWLAGLLAHGLVRGSFVPSESQRDLRDLTRQRAQLIGQRSRVVNRVQKVLEDAGIKLGSVASDVMGQSGRAMIEALVADNQTPEQMADLAKRALRRKIP